MHSASQLDRARLGSAEVDLIQTSQNGRGRWSAHARRQNSGSASALRLALEVTWRFVDVGRWNESNDWDPIFACDTACPRRTANLRHVVWAVCMKRTAHGSSVFQEVPIRQRRMPDNTFRIVGDGTTSWIQSLDVLIAPLTVRSRGSRDLNWTSRSVGVQRTRFERAMTKSVIASCGFCSRPLHRESCRWMQTVRS